jgi:hypothetical protein
MRMQRRAYGQLRPCCVIRKQTSEHTREKYFLSQVSIVIIPIIRYDVSPLTRA